MIKLEKAIVGISYQGKYEGLFGFIEILVKSNHL